MRQPPQHSNTTTKILIGWPKFRASLLSPDLSKIWLAKGLAYRAKPKTVDTVTMRRWESNQTKKKAAMVARARARDAKRHERREQTAVDRSRKLAASLSESNATNEA